MPGTLHTPGYTAFVEIIVATRRARGLTQQQVADALAKPQSYVAKIEGGERRLDILEFVALCRAMDADPKAVFAAALAAIDQSG